MSSTTTKVTEAQIRETAHEAAKSYFTNVLGGKDRLMCGFACVAIIPTHKGNTALGRAERAEFRTMGFELSYDRKSFQMWNPANMMCQNIDTIHTGAKAAANLLKLHGYNAYTIARLD